MKRIHIIFKNIAGEVIFKITPSDDHPVDLYFVMDLSNSMVHYQENLVGASLAIAEKIRNTTTKFRMGFGSFSDKPTAPFAGTQWLNFDIFYV